MDIIADGLWAVVVAKAVNKKLKKPLNAWLAGFWGIFPDIFSFWIAAVWVLWGTLFGTLHFSDLPHHPDSGDQMPQNAFWVFQLSFELYNISHSVVIFFVIFFGIWILFRRPPLETFGWLVHVLVDIPTHTHAHFATPFLWPLSEWKFNGFAANVPWFFVVNYIVLAVLFYLLRQKKKKVTSSK